MKRSFGEKLAAGIRAVAGTKIASDPWEREESSVSDEELFNTVERMIRESTEGAGISPAVLTGRILAYIAKVRNL